MYINVCYTQYFLNYNTFKTENVLTHEVHLEKLNFSELFDILMLMIP